jgi:hypothetical protein
VNEIRYRSDNLIQLNGPVDNSTGLPVSATPTSNTARLFNERKEVLTSRFETRLTNAALAAAGEIAVPKFTPSIFEVNDTMIIHLDDGTIDTEVIDAIDASNAGWDLLSLTGTLGGAAAAGNTVELKTKATTKTLLVVDRAGSIELGDQLEILQDGGTLLVTTLTQVQQISGLEDTDNVTATAAPNQLIFHAMTIGALTAACSAGCRIRVKLGADLTLGSFGVFPTANPIIGDSTWGFRTTLPDTHADLRIGQDVRIEITHDGGAGLQLVDAIRAKVVEGA